MGDFLYIRPYVHLTPLSLKAPPSRLFYRTSFPLGPTQLSDALPATFEALKAPTEPLPVVEALTAPSQALYRASEVLPASSVALSNHLEALLTLMPPLPPQPFPHQFSHRIRRASWEMGKLGTLRILSTTSSSKQR